MEEIREHQIEEATDVGNQETPSWFRSKAVAVHLYTASGAVLALLMLVAAFQGEAVKALWLMLASLLIDSTDGLLARRFRVSEALPFFDEALASRLQPSLRTRAHFCAPESAVSSPAGSSECLRRERATMLGWSRRLLASRCLGRCACASSPRPDSLPAFA